MSAGSVPLGPTDVGHPIDSVRNRVKAIVRAKQVRLRDVSDAVQDALTDLVTKKCPRTGRPVLDAFICPMNHPVCQAKQLIDCIARRRAIDYIRGYVHDREIQVADEDEPGGGLEALWLWADDHARRIDAQEAFEKLSGRQKQVVTLKLLGGLTEREIAEQLELSLGTVSGAWRLAMDRLEEAIF